MARVCRLLSCFAVSLLSPPPSSLSTCHFAAGWFSIRCGRAFRQVGFSDWADQAVFDEAVKMFEEQMLAFGEGVPECVRSLQIGDDGNVRQGVLL
jgi:hypothetical protein